MTVKTVTGNLFHILTPPLKLHKICFELHTTEALTVSPTFS